MKKFLLSLLCLIGIGVSAYAAQCALVPEGNTELTDQTVTNRITMTGDITNWSNIQFEGIATVAFTTVNTNTSKVSNSVVRFYQGDKVTFTPVENVTITEIYIKGGDTASNGGSKVKASDNSTITSVNSGKDGKWTGSCTKNNPITLETTAQVRFSYILITYTEGSQQGGEQGGGEQGGEQGGDQGGDQGGEFTSPAVFTNWTTLFNVEANGQISSVKANSIDWTGTVNGVTLNVKNGTSTNGYLKTDDFRAYSGYTLTFTAPTGKKITGMTSTKGGSKAFSTGIACEDNKGTLTITDSTMKWTGSESTVVLTISGTVSFKTITVEFGDGEEQGSGEDPEPGYTLVGDGTLDSPYTVADALYLITKDEATTDKVYVAGKISDITEINTIQYGNATYVIVDEGKTETLTVFRCYYSNNEANKKFTAEDQIKVNDAVVVCGVLKEYNGTKEITNCYIVTLNGASTEPEQGGEDPNPGEDPQPGEGEDPQPSEIANPYSFVFANGDLTTSQTSFESGNVKWTLSETENSWNGNANQTGYVFGSAKNTKTLTISTDEIPGTITKVEVTGRSNNKNQTATVAVVVNETEEFSSSNNTWNNGNNQTLTFTGSASGLLAVTITPDACGYVLSGIKVYYNTDNTPDKKPSSVTFEESAVSVASNSGYQGQEAVCSVEGAVLTYTSSDENVATVGDNGAIALVGVGVTTIKAEYKGDEEYNGSFAEYTLTVTEPVIEGADTYESPEFNKADMLACGETKVVGEAAWYAEWDNTNGGDSYKTISTKTFQFGSTNNPASTVKLVSESFEGYNIASVKVSARTSAKGATIRFKLGNEVVYSTDITNSANLADFTWTPASPVQDADPLTIEMVATDSSKAFFLGAIKVSYFVPETPDNLADGHVRTYLNGVEKDFSTITAEDLTKGAKLKVRAVPGIEIHYALVEEANAAENAPAKVAAKGDGYNLDDDAWTKADSHVFTYEVTDDLKGKSLLVVAAHPETGEQVVKGVKFASDGTVTGIESVEAADAQAPVEYFNLQGQRVANPSNGLFIRRQGASVEKVVL